MTPEAEADFIDLKEEGTMPPKRRALLRAVWEEVELLRKLEKTLRVVVDDEDYEAGFLYHHGSCNTNHAWGPGEAPCDCYVKDVMGALEDLKT